MGHRLQVVERHDGFHSPSWTHHELASDSFHAGINPLLQTHFILDKAGAVVITAGRDTLKIAIRAR